MILKKHYGQTLLFFRRDLLKLFLGVGIGFFAVLLLMHFALLGNETLVKELFHQVSEMFESKGIIGEDMKISFGMLFLNNIKASMLTVIIGFLPFLFLPAISLASNAAVIGMITSFSSISGISMVSVAAGVLPHGVFELPGLFLSGALGIYLCKEISLRAFRKARDQKLSVVIQRTAQLYLLVGIPLFLAAALVETYLTPLIMKSVM